MTLYTRTGSSDIGLILQNSRVLDVGEFDCFCWWPVGVTVHTYNGNTYNRDHTKNIPDIQLFYNILGSCWTSGVAVVVLM